MRKLEYIGPKPIISHRGIDFDKNHDDKFNYLPALLELIRALDHEYFENKQYTFDANPQSMNSHEILNALQKHCENFDTLIEDVEKNVQKDMNEQLQRVQENTTLENDDKIAYKNNIKIMQEYLTNYSINEALYNCALKKLAQIVTKDHINYIIVPMFQKFAYVLHQLQAILKDQKHPVDTKLDIIEEDGELIAKLQVISLV